MILYRRDLKKEYGNDLFGQIEQVSTLIEHGHIARFAAYEGDEIIVCNEYGVYFMRTIGWFGARGKDWICQDKADIRRLIQIDGITQGKQNYEFSMLSILNLIWKRQRKEIKYPKLNMKKTTEEINLINDINRNAFNTIVVDWNQTNANICATWKMFW